MLRRSLGTIFHREVYKSSRHFSSAAQDSKSIDASNMKVLSDMKDFWWDPMGVVRPLHEMNTIRIPFIRDGLINTGVIEKANLNTPHVLKGLKILDIGCGGGILTESLAKLQATVVGLEPAKELYDVAREHADKQKDKNLQLSYLNKTIEDLCTEESNWNRFDCVVLSEVVEHVNNPAQFLELCLKTLKPGGSVFITTFNKTISSFAFGIVIAEYLTNIVPRHTHEWDKFIALPDLHKMIESNDFSVLQTIGTMYQPWNNTWKAIRSTDVSYAVHAVKH